MNNYPDNFRGTNMDSRPEEKFPVEVAQIENAQMAYREIIEAAILILKRRGFTHYPPKDGYNSGINRLAFLDIEELLRDSVSGELKTLQEYDYDIEGDGCEKFYDRMYALLKGDENKEPLTTDELTAIIDVLDKFGRKPVAIIGGSHA